MGNWPFGHTYTVEVDSQRNLAFCGSGGGVFILDISDPLNPVKICDKIRTRDFVWSLVYEESTRRLYIAAGKAGLEIWNLADSLNPQKIGWCKTYGEVHGVDILGDYAYLAAGNAGLRIISIADPSNPEEVGFYRSPSGPLALSASESYIYVANGEVGLQIYSNSPSGIDEEKKKNRKFLKISKNLFLGTTEVQVLNIELPITLGVYDITGRVVEKSVIYNSSPVTVGIDLSSGVYFLRVKGFKPEKIIKLK